MSYQRSLGSTQSRPSNFVRVHRSTSLGSSQSRPSNFVRVHRSTPMGASAAEYSLVSSLVGLINKIIPAKPAARPAPVRMPARGMQGFGSLGDATDAEPTTSLAQPSLTSPTIVDPAATAAWQQAMLDQTKLIAASQQDFTSREITAKWVQIAATLSIPLAAAAWRMLGRLLEGRRAQRDYE